MPMQRSRLMRPIAAAALTVTIAAGTLAVAADEPTTRPAATMPTSNPAAVTKAVATLAPGKAATTRPTANHVTGTVTFTAAEGGTVAFVADVDGLEPNSVHGFHIHEKGDLSAADLSSAGGHYNPTHDLHAGPDAPHHHAGDLGNLTADDQGHAHLTGTVGHVSLGGENSILDRSVIVHAKADDLKSQPAGDSGSRIAGGVITADKTP